jgi:hypothetical protein
VNYAKLLEMALFLLDISFFKLAKHMICQVKFSKLLEMCKRWNGADLGLVGIFSYIDSSACRVELNYSDVS